LAAWKVVSDDGEEAGLDLGEEAKAELARVGHNGLESRLLPVLLPAAVTTLPSTTYNSSSFLAAATTRRERFVA
jgi:hypothetical protein